MQDKALRDDPRRGWHPAALVTKAAPIASVAGAASFFYFSVTGGGHPQLAFSAAVVVTSLPATLAQAVGIIGEIVKRRTPHGIESLRELGCDRLYRGRSEAMTDIAQALLDQVERKNGRFYLLGVADRDFLHFRYRLKDGSYLLNHLIAGLNDDESRTKGAFIILDYECEEATRWAAFEQGPQTLAELNLSHDSYVEFFAKNPRIQLGLYRLRPWIFALVTDEIAFVQRYPAAPPTDWPGGCFGDLLHLERYPAQTDGYRLIKDEIVRLYGDAAVRWL
jgi:hypothetical protein